MEKLTVLQVAIIYETLNGLDNTAIANKLNVSVDVVIKNKRKIVAALTE